MSDCLFCKIVAGEIPAKVVAESDTALAFYDITPQAPVHVLVIPKRHFDSVNDVTESDRGVFDPPSLSAIAYDDRCRFVTGRVTDVASAGGGEGVRLEYESPEGGAGAEHEYVVNCTGFDLLAQLRQLFSPELQAEIERRSGGLWERRRGEEIPIGRFLELKGVSPRLQIPGLAGLSQGPGFANLGALGLLSNRVLQPLLAERSGPPELGGEDSLQYKSLLLE